MLRAPVDLGGYPASIRRCCATAEGGDYLLALPAGPTAIRLNVAVGIGIKHLERQIIELPLKMADAEAAGKRA